VFSTPLGDFYLQGSLMNEQSYNMRDILTFKSDGRIIK